MCRKGKRIEPDNSPVEVQVLDAPDEKTGDGLREQLLIDIASLHESKRLYELTIERIEKEGALPILEEKEAPPASVPKENDSLIEEIKSTKKKN